MENYEKSPNADLFLGVDLASPEDVLKKCKEFLNQDLKFDAFQMACRGFRTSRDIRLKYFIENVAKCQINHSFLEKMTGIPMEDYLSDAIHNPNSFLFRYENLISLCMTHSGSVEITAIFILSEMNDVSYPTDLIASTVKFKAKAKGWGQTLWQMIYNICKHHPDDHILEFLINKIIFWNIELIPGLYRFYSYLDQPQVVRTLLKCVSDIQILFTGESLWPHLPVGYLEIKYQKILKAMKKGENPAGILEENKIASLVPLCLYSMDRGNIEIEVYALWYAMKQSESMAIFERMLEITGFEIPSDFQKMKLSDRGPWMTERLQKCRQAFDSNKFKLNETNTQKAKDLFSIKPFSIDVLRNLLKIDSISKDPEIKKMLELSIGKISIPVILGKVLSYSITFGNEYGIKLVLARLANLDYYSTILFSVEKILPYIEESDNESLRLISEVLDFYSKHVPNDKFDADRLVSLKQYSTTLVDRLFSEEEQSEILQIVDIKKLLEKKQYQKVFTVIEGIKNPSSNLLELVLKSAIKSGISTHVVRAYGILARKDGTRASFYNFQVEYYFLMCNGKKTTKTTGGNLVSKVWEAPVFLENPANMQALRVAGLSSKPKGH